MTIRVYRNTASTGVRIAEITDPLLECTTDYRAYGGCDRAYLRFKKNWSQPLVFVADKEDEIEITSNNISIFRGRVVEVKPNLEKSEQEVEVDGWIKRIDEIPRNNPRDDRIVFGPADDTDFEDTKTAFDVAEYLVDTYVVGDSNTNLTKGTFTAPTAKCKFGTSGFAVYAADQLTSVLDQLAMMEDCLWGIDANNSFYFIPRTTVLASTGIELRAAESPAANWRSSLKAYALSGDFTQKRIGPNWIRVAGRDKNKIPATRSYCYESSLDSDTRRWASIDAPGVRSGPGARRLARGFFRRYSKTSLQVESLECLAPSRRFEPHLGACKVYNESVLLVSEVAGNISVNWLGTRKISATLGENQSNPGSGNPVNDPLAQEYSSRDWGQVDTGEGDPPTYTIPSQCIDEDDGHDGDGDDLHTNDDRDEPSDDPGMGVDGVDYGPDIIDPTNGSAPGADNAGPQGPAGPTGATGATGPAGPESNVHITAMIGVFSA